MKPDRWDQIKRIYLLALEREPVQRDAFLNETCAGDDELRREVNSLLAYERRAEQFIESSAFEVAAKALAADEPGGSLSGRNIGPYTVLSLIGVGGMGEVYRARDTRLNRTVAIKVLPAAVADRPEQKLRLHREAKAIAALNHPNICVLHDIRHDEGIDYLVMECLDGETLADRLRKGPLPIEEVLKYAIQIADALDKAHRHGVVHRDLKPGNIILTRTGLKLLDFGLAKVGVPLPGLRPIGNERPLEDSSVASNAPGRLTGQGVIVGTLQYMSPEQLEGKEADARTDIFAFGAVLYEMVTGRKAFDGKSQVSVMAAIMDHVPPPVSTIQPLASPLLDHLTHSCLEKNPDQRWQSIADVLMQLRLIAATTTSHPTAPTKQKSSVRERAVWALAGLVIGAVAFAGFFVSPRPAADPSLMRFQIETPPSGFPTHVAISPDGRRLVAVIDTDKGELLWLRRMDGLEPQILSGTEGAQNPFWSPDGRFVGFFAGGKLKKVGMFGASPETICDASPSWGGSWSRDDVILMGAPNGPLLRVAASGGPVTPVTRLDASREELRHIRPYFLPDGQHFLFLAQSAKRENSAVFVGSLDSSPPRRLLASELKAAFTPPNHLLFVHDTTLMAQEFDIDRLELQGDPVTVVEGVNTNTGPGQAGFTASETGLLAYRGGGATANRQLLLADRSGRSLGFAGTPAAFQNPVFSPDGQVIGASLLEPGRDLWVMNVANGAMSRFTSNPAEEDYPIWSPDKTRIVFSSNRDGGIANLYGKPSNGSAPEELLFKSQYPKIPLSWSADGRHIAYEERHPQTKSDLWVFRMDGEQPLEFLQSPFNETQAQFSPDGRWVAYVSDQSGRQEVYIRSFPRSETEWQISTNLGFQPRWREDGKQLFYLASEGTEQFMAVDVEADSSKGLLRIGESQRLFAFDVISQNQRNSYDVLPGQRFLLNLIPRPTGSFPLITFVLNWASALERN
jgi:serine/threonine protein kinase